MCKGAEESGTVEEVSYPQLLEAKVAAQELRRMFEGLSALEKAVAGKQIAAVRRLVEAVERL